MHAVIRRYTAAAALGDKMVALSDEVRDLISAVPGFSAYYALRDGDMITTVTVCADKAGTDASSQAAKDFITAKLSGISISAPDVTQGDTILNF